MNRSMGDKISSIGNELALPYSVADVDAFPSQPSGRFKTNTHTAVMKVIVASILMTFGAGGLLAVGKPNILFIAIDDMRP